MQPETHKIMMPKFVHEAFGEWQTKKSLSAIALVVIFIAVIWGPSLGDLDLWRQALAGVLILDIAAGAVANFTKGTNGFYASRPRHRWWFIALHFHLPFVGLALNEPLLPYLIVWAYTIGAASFVNAMGRSKNQTFAAGLLMCIGIVGMLALPLSDLGMMIGLLFLFKVAFSFAVDHYA